MSSNQVHLWTDGAASNNGKENAIGGWGYIIVQNNEQVTCDSGGVKGASNQQMELTAAIEGLKHLEQTSDCFGFLPVIVHSDSAYLINCMKQNWWRSWQSNGWRNSKKQPVANKELWEQLIPYFQMANITWEKVSGHSGVEWNEKVDLLAVTARQKVEKE